MWICILRDVIYLVCPRLVACIFWRLEALPPVSRYELYHTWPGTARQSTSHMLAFALARLCPWLLDDMTGFRVI